MLYFFFYKTDKNYDKVSAWLSEVEDDYVLNNSDDTDVDSNFCIQNNLESEIDESHITYIQSLTTSNVYRRLLSFSSDNSSMVSEPDFFLGKDKITKWYKNNLLSNVCIHCCNIVLHLPGVKQIATDAQ